MLLSSKRLTLKPAKRRMSFWANAILELTYDKLSDIEQLRFQIEFNFRLAQTVLGFGRLYLSSKTAVYNASVLAMFMVNLSSTLLRQNPRFGSSVNDLKAWFRARKYVLNTLKFSEQNADNIFIELNSSSTAILILN